jgi:hypothetical protein
MGLGRALLLAGFLAACSSESKTTTSGGDSGPCPPGTVLVYSGPGCGEAAKTACFDEKISQDACLVQRCGCDGVVRADGCDVAEYPYRRNMPLPFQQDAVGSTCGAEEPDAAVE